MIVVIIGLPEDAHYFSEDNKYITNGLKNKFSQRNCITQPRYYIYFGITSLTLIERILPS